MKFLKARKNLCVNYELLKLRTQVSFRKIEEKCFSSNEITSCFRIITRYTILNRKCHIKEITSKFIFNIYYFF